MMFNRHTAQFPADRLAAARLAEMHFNVEQLSSTVCGNNKHRFCKQLRQLFYFALDSRLRGNDGCFIWRKTVCCSLVPLLMMFAGIAAGQTETADRASELGIPLVEQEPFDLLKLDELNGNIEIRISPQKTPVPDPLPDQGFLVFEATQLADDFLQVPYRNVVKYSSFNDLLREEANQFSRDKEYGKAFRNLLFVYDHGGKDDGELANTIQNLLFRDGARNYLAGNYELALTIFQDIYDLNPDFEAPEISKTPIELILDCLDKNIAANFERERFDQVRAAVNQLEIRYGADASSMAEKWEAQLLATSDRMLAEARRLADSGDGKLAHLTARRANTVLPGRPEALAMFQEIVDQYPIVFVGVSSSGVDADPLNLDNWGARRVGKLTMRTVVEFDGPGDDGGKYEFLNGTIEPVDDNGLVYRFTIVPVATGFAIPPIDAYELSRRMLARGIVGSPDYNIPFARIVDTIEIEGEFSVIVTLKHAHVRPEALFQFPYGAFDQTPPSNGPYVMAEQTDNVMVYHRNAAYPDLEQAQHPQIIEWRYATPSQAVSALIAGEVDVVDRINLADMRRLEENASISIGSYIVPTVHMLVPNIRNDFTADRSFRNGLQQGINRELILNEVICGGNEINGCEVISGPFPIGTEENDQLSYAYNLKVLPQPYNELLGMVLARVVFETQVNSLIKQGVKNPTLEIPTIVLAFPVDEVAELACINIQQMWSSMGLNVVLRELEDGVVIPPDDRWDFLYHQMSMQEPLTDVENLFGPDGVVQQLGAPAVQNMQRLGYVDSWQQVGRILRELHRQVVNDVSIIPLWQLKEHFAFRENLKGVGRNPVHLYQNVARWRIVSTTKEN